MIGRYQGRNLTVNEIEMLAMLLRNEIADIIQDEFAREINHLVYEEARRFCEGCEMDDPSQMHHNYMMKEQEEIWICHYEEAKKHLKVDKLWLAIEERIHKKLDVYPQADHSMCSCSRRESMRVMNKVLKIAHLNHVLV